VTTISAKRASALAKLTDADVSDLLGSPAMLDRVLEDLASTCALSAEADMVPAELADEPGDRWDGLS
jgi:hypothetical protein